MLSRYSEKNTFGGYTWHIKIDSLFHIFIEETNDNLFIIEFKEWKWISFKKHFSLVSHTGIESTIITAFDKVFDFFKNNSKYNWEESQKINSLNKVLGEYKRMKNSL